MKFLFFILLSIGSYNAYTQTLVIPNGHTKKIYRAVFSPDGKLILSSSNDGTVKLWDSNTGDLLRDFRSKSFNYSESFFSKDGKSIFFSSDDSVWLVDIKTNKTLQTFNGAIWNIKGFATNKQESCLITLVPDKTVVIWDIRTGLVIDSLFGYTHETGYYVSFSPDGESILTVSKQKVQLWDTGGRIKSTWNNDLYEINDARFSPDGSKLLIAYDYRKLWVDRGYSLDYSFINAKPSITLYEVASGKLLQYIENRNKNFETPYFKVIGSAYLASNISPDSSVNLIEFNSGKVIKVISNQDLLRDVVQVDENRVLLKKNPNSIIDFVTGDSILFPKELKNVSGAIYSPGKRFLLTYGDELELWDAQTLKQLRSFRGHMNTSATISFPPGGKMMWQSPSYLWDIATNTLVDANAPEPEQKEGGRIMIQDGESTVVKDTATDKIVFTMSPFATELLGLNADGTKSYIGNHLVMMVEDTRSGKLLHVMNTPDSIKELYTRLKWVKAEAGRSCSAGGYSIQKEPNEYFDWIIIKQNGEGVRQFERQTAELTALSTDGKKALIYGNSLGFLYDIDKKQLLRLFYFPDEVYNIVFSPDNRKLAVGSFSIAGTQVWDIEKGRVEQTIPSFISEYAREGVFSIDGSWLITGGYQSLAIWNIHTGKLVKSFDKDLNFISNAQFSPNGNTVFTVHGDNSTKRWDISTGKLQATFFTVDSSDYFVQEPTGYYMSSPGASKRLYYVTESLMKISFEQLDVKYNRPDLVLQAIGNKDTALIKAYRKAYEKRIKKLGIDTTAFRSGYSVPEADFANRDKIEFGQKDGKLKLDIKSGDSTYKLDRFNVWVNETPVFGQRGISLRTKNKNNFDTTIIIDLSQGENKIETSITNVNGTESYRMPLMVNYIPVIEQKEKVYFIGIGIDKFIESKYNLKYSTKDIRDLSNKLKEKYKDIIIDTLLNANVTISNVKALKQKLLKTNVNDKVIISYSGHGLLSKDFDYYLSTYSVNFKNPEQNGLPYEELENLFDSIPARKKLMLIDACHSGEVDKEEMQKYNMTESNEKNSMKKGVLEESLDSATLGLKNSFELMKELFVNVGRSTGATIISAAGGTQSALEGGKLKNGAFTFSILEYMKDHATATITELKQYVNKRVPELTNGLQVPTSRNENKMLDWSVWEANN